MIHLFRRGFAQCLPHFRCAGGERLAFVECLGTHFPDMVHAHQRRGMATLGLRELTLLGRRRVPLCIGHAGDGA